MPRPPEKTDEFSSLIRVVEALLGPDGCPWDKEQTHQTLTQYALEEAHEFAEAADQKDVDGIVEELGDLLLQVVLNAEIARLQGTFSLKDVIQSITEKMIRRHPHVFSDLKVTGAQDVLDRWGDLKASEKPAKTTPFDGIPKALPALLRANKIGAKTKQWKFDWAQPSDVLKKVQEELGELVDAMEKRDTNAISHEIGDLLFSTAQLARHYEIDPEQALRHTNQRFETRFLEMQRIAKADGLDFTSLSETQLENLWQKAKLRVN